MSFASPTFLFLFLPIVLGLHRLTPSGGRNAFLLVASLAFYAWAEAEIVFVLIATILANFVLTRAMSRSRRHRRRWLLAILAVDLGVLGWFKYAGFAWTTLDQALTTLGATALPALTVALPAGVSFFVLQLVSYSVDVARGRTPPQPDLVRFALYVTLFPQLVAGPIVRYATFAAQLGERRIAQADFAAGVRRFAVGLAKKVLIADTLGRAIDPTFAVPGAQIDAGTAWFGIVAYGLQLYCDFSGYSDMAIGLGRMLGFRLPENFDYPYAATSMRRFWTRWHMTLTLWLRDYLLTALPRARGQGPGVARNLTCMFVLVGLWHGAALHFVAWGLFHGAVLIAEHFVLGRRLERLPRWCGLAWVHAVVLANWPLFRCASLDHALDYYRALAGLAPAPHAALPAPGNEAWLCLLLAAAGSAPWLGWVRRRWPWPAVLPWASAVACVLLLLACWLKIAARGHVPFLYFRF